MSKTLRKYPGASCAQCGATIHGKGYFCSYRCDVFEYEARAATSKAAFEAGRPIKRKGPA